MRWRRLVLIVSLAIFSGALAAQTPNASSQNSQNSPSLADIARQSRQQKQQQEAQAQSTDQSAASNPQTTDPNAKPQPKAPHVYTNDEIPEHTGPDVNPVQTPSAVHENYRGGKLSAEQWKSQILQVKHNIASLQKQIETMQNSIHFAGGNYERHVAYNERQRQKQQQIEVMQSQLTEMQKHLEDMQETARHQGYSSAVYDP